MSVEPEQCQPSSLPIPPSYAQCVAGQSGPRFDYVVSPLGVALLMFELGFEFDEEENG
jgi:hypothetical protein